MSTQLQSMGAHAPGLVAVVAQSVRTRISNIVDRVIAHRLARAEREVRAVLTSFSAQRLAEYGWRPEDIHRLKSR